MNIKLIPFEQKGYKMYWFVCDPNLIYERSTFKNIVDGDDNAQRPYNKTRVKEIEKYILWNDTISKNTSLKKKAIWLIPNAIILNIPNSYIKKDDIVFTDSDEKDIQILDWQHRLLAFTKDNIEKIWKKYEVFFITFVDLEIDLKQEIFMVVNERQQNVDKNILLRQKKLLWILLDENEVRYDFISRLWDEKDSPLFWKIIFTKEVIRYWIKLVQLDDIIKKAKIMNLPWILWSDMKIHPKSYEAIINYLKSWKEPFEKQWFQWNTITKVAWFRLLFWLFEYYSNIIKSNFDSKFSLENSKIITNYIIDNYFNENFNVDDFDDYIKSAFRERSMTENLVTKIWTNITEHFNAEKNLYFK